MKNYEIKLFPIISEDGKTEWCAEFPAFKGVVGGGETPQEAITEAEANLDGYINYLREEKLALPEEYRESEFSGKLSIRIPRSLHKDLKEQAEREGVSLNQIINYYLSLNDGKIKSQEKMNYNFIGEIAKRIDYNISNMKWNEGVV